MKYLVYSRSRCERYCEQRHTNTSVIISIRSSFDRELPNLPMTDGNGVKDILYLSFDDVDIDMVIKYRANFAGFISDGQAKQIYEFCDKWYGKVDTFVFHCDAGISRSAGCCGAIMRWFEGYDYPIMGKKSKYPNMYCYTKVLDACRGVSEPITKNSFGGGL